MLPLCSILENLLDQADGCALPPEQLRVVLRPAVDLEVRDLGPVLLRVQLAPVQLGGDLPGAHRAAGTFQHDLDRLVQRHRGPPGLDEFREQLLQLVPELLRLARAGAELEHVDRVRAGDRKVFHACPVDGQGDVDRLPRPALRDNDLVSLHGCASFSPCTGTSSHVRPSRKRPPLPCRRLS